MISPASGQPQLCGQIVLIAEPNPLIALDLAAMFSAWGAQPLLYYDLDGPAQLAAYTAARAALIDVPLDCEPLSGLIAALMQHGVPTALTTAGGAADLGERFPRLAVFDKPVDYLALAQWLCAAVPSARTAAQSGSG